MFELFTSKRSTNALVIDQSVADNPYVERVVLPDGQVMMVARGSLVAAKTVIAARKAALRRLEAQYELERETLFQREHPMRERRAS